MNCYRRRGTSNAMMNFDDKIASRRTFAVKNIIPGASFA
jgi:hypothetical protein